MLTVFFKLQENGFMSFRKKIARVTFLLAVISLACMLQQLFYSCSLLHGPFGTKNSKNL